MEGHMRAAELEAAESGALARSLVVMKEGPGRRVGEVE